MHNIVETKNEIKKLKNISENDKKVLSIIDSFWGCNENYIKAHLASTIAKYAGCAAWKIAMKNIYE